MTIADFAYPEDLEAYRAGDPEAILVRAQSTIRSYCEWHVAPSITETILLDGHGSRHLWLPSLHVDEIASITNEGTSLTADEYDWSASGYVELRGGYWTARPRQIQVVFTHGYLYPPADLVGVATAIAARAASSPAGIIREAAGSVSLDYGTVELLDLEKVTLDRYKLPPRP